MARSTRHRARRVGGILLIAILTLVLLVVSTVLVVLFVPPASRAVLGRTIDWYDDQIPGEVVVERMEGSLARGVRIHGVRLEDGLQQPVVSARMLRLRLRPGPLLIGRVRLELTLDGAVVRLWPAGGLADLVPERPEPDVPPDELGPDLPLSIGAEIELHDVDVFQYAADDEPTPLVRDLRLAAGIRARGTEASVAIDHASGRVLDAAQVENLEAAVRWSSPRLDVDRLIVHAEEGSIEAHGFWDARSEALGLDLSARVELQAITDDPSPLDALDGVTTLDAAVRAAGTTRGLRLDLQAAAGERLRASATGAATLSPRVSVVLDGTAEIDPIDAPALHASFVAAARQRAEGLEASSSIACTTCPEPLGLTAFATMLDERWWVRTEVRAPRLVVDARARGTSEALSSAVLRARVRSTAPLRRALEPWVALPEVDGRITARARCLGGQLDDCRFATEVRELVTPAVDARRVVAEGEIQLVNTRRRLDVGLRAEGLDRAGTAIGDVDLRIRGTTDALDIVGRLDGPPGTLATLDMRVQPSERTRIDLRDLAIVHRGLRSHLLAPARIEVSAEEVDVDALRLRVGSGTVTASGTVSTRRTSDLRITAGDIVLSELDPLLPGPAIEGLLSATLGLRGTLERPEALLDMHASEVVAAGMQLGSVDARVALRHDAVAGRLHTRDGLARRASAAFRFPIEVDLREAHLHIPDRRALQIDAVVDQLDLARLPEALTAEPVRGTIDARLTAEGTTRAPVVGSRVSGRGLSIAGRRLGDATVVLAYEDERATVRVRAQGPVARELRAEASLPMRLDLAAPAIELHEHRELDLAMTGEAVNLASPRAWIPDWPASGLVDVTATGEGSVADWRAHTIVRGHELAYAGRPLGDTLIDLEVTPDHGDLDLRMTGPLARRLHVRAHAPLRTDDDRWMPTWDPHGRHVIDALLQDLDIETLARLVPGLALSGRVEGVVHVEGSVDDASGALDLATGRLAWQGRRLGRVWLAARYDGDRVIALAEQQSGQGSWIRARLEVPVSLLDHDPWMRWERTEQHALSLHAAGVDEHLVGAFVELPAETRLATSARLRGEGHLEEFRLAGQMRGRIGREAPLRTTFSADLDVGPSQQELRAVLGGNGIETLDIVARTSAPLVDLVRGDADLQDVPFEMRMEADRLALETFEPVLPTALDGLRGVLQARAFGSGTVGDPDLRGFVEVQDGAVTVVPMLQRFEDADVFAVLEGSRIRLETLDVRSGRGETTARGQVLFENGALRAHLVARARDLPLVQPGLPIMTLDTRIVATADTRPDVTEVSVTAENTQINVLATTVDAPRSIPASDDIVFVDRRPPPEAPARAVDPPEVPSDLRMTFRLGTPAVVGGPNVDMEWDGALELTRIAGTTRVVGALETTRGRFFLLGREFDLERGVITLPEAETIDPFIDLVATTEFPDASVTVTLRGRASRPDLRLTSTPPMPETEVFALLVTGSPGGARDEGTEFDAQAAAMLAVFNNPVIASHLRETIGIDRVGVAFGEDIENPIVTVGRRLTRRLYLETRYHHDAPENENTTEVRLDFAFAPPRWSLQTRFGDAAVGGVEIWWQRRFGGR